MGLSTFRVDTNGGFAFGEPVRWLTWPELAADAMSLMSSCAMLSSSRCAAAAS